MAVSGVAEAGHDERVLVVEPLVDGRGVDREIEAGLLEHLDALGRGEHAHNDDGAGGTAPMSCWARVG